jgi:hypothetical protein
MDESLCATMQKGLGTNETLEKSELNGFLSTLWCRAFSFLRTNKGLKSLVVGARGSCVSAFRIDLAVILQENASLESLTILGGSKAKAEEYVALVTALQPNRTLKKLCCVRALTLTYWVHDPLMTDDEDKHVAKILKKTYALESLPELVLDNRAGDLAMFRNGHLPNVPRQIFATE